MRVRWVSRSTLTDAEHTLTQPNPYLQYILLYSYINA